MEMFETLQQERVENKANLHNMLTTNKQRNLIGPNLFPRQHCGGSLKDQMVRGPVWHTPVPLLPQKFCDEFIPDLLAVHMVKQC